MACVPPSARPTRRSGNYRRVAAARGVIEEERLLAVLHASDEIDAVFHPHLIAILDVVQIDQFNVVALLRVLRRAVHVGFAELQLLHEREALGAEGDFRFEVDVAPLGVHVRYAKEAAIVVVADVLRQRRLVLAHVPFPHALRHVPELLEDGGQRHHTVEPPGLAVHRRP
jgi:hypothetical protein